MPDRTLILARHGQYWLEPSHPRHGGLTPLGERQARRLGKRLASRAIDVVHSSTAPRALETVACLQAHLPGVPHRRSKALLEGLPTQLKGLSREARDRVIAHRARMEGVFARSFKPARGRDRTELWVFHGNFIRFLLRRALGDAASKWWRLSVMHCGLSIVKVPDDGVCRLLAFNDVGHLPPSMHTFE